MLRIAGYTRIGLKAVNEDMTSRNGFLWPYPGPEGSAELAEAAGPFHWDNMSLQPRCDGDGLCLAFNAATVYSQYGTGNRVNGRLLVAAYRPQDVLATAVLQPSFYGARVTRCRVLPLAMDPRLVFYRPGVDLAGVSNIAALLALTAGIALTHITQKDTK